MRYVHKSDFSIIFGYCYYQIFTWLRLLAKRDVTSLTTRLCWLDLSPTLRYWWQLSRLWSYRTPLLLF